MIQTANASLPSARNLGVLPSGYLKLATSLSVGTVSTVATIPTSDITGTIAASNLTGTLAAAQFPALTGDVTTAIGSLTTAISALAVTNAMLAGSIALSKINATVGSIVFGGAGGVLAQNNANLFWDNTTLRLGIGGNPTLAKLQVTSGNINLDTNQAIQWGANVFWLGNSATNILAAYTSGSERVRIDATGRVGIGTAAPSATAEIVGGELRIQGAAGFGTIATTGKGVEFAFNQTTSIGLVLCYDRDLVAYKQLQFDATPLLFNVNSQGYIGTGTGVLFGIGLGAVSPAATFSVLDKFLVNSSAAISKYQNITTVGWGVPAIYGSGRSTAQTGAVASVATYTVGAADGSFLVSMNILVTAFTVGTVSGVITYTDEGNTARSLTMNFSAITGVLNTTVGAAGAFEGVPLHIRTKASTVITVTTTVSAFTGTYNVEGAILQLA